MIVNGALFDPPILQNRDHAIHFRFEQDEIAHHHGVIAIRGEGNPRSECERRLDRHALNDDVKIAARKRYFVNAARLHRSVAAEGVADVVPLDRGEEEKSSDHRSLLRPVVAWPHSRLASSRFLAGTGGYAARLLLRKAFRPLVECRSETEERR